MGESFGVACGERPGKGVAVTSREFRDLLELFGQEKACYTSLLDLSRRQKSVIEAGEVEALLTIISQKQSVLYQVAGVEDRLIPYKRNWRAVRESIDEDDRQMLDMALSTVGELLAELIALEKESEEILSHRRDQTRVELVEAARGRAVHEKYASGPADSPARYLDVRSDAK
jgi:hypothetical protein